MKTFWNKQWALLTVLLAASSVWARGRDHDRRPPPPVYGCPNVVAIPVNMEYQGYTTLPIRQMLNLGYQCEGKIVEQVVVESQSTGWWSSARGSLYVNGYLSPYTEQNIDNKLRARSFYLQPGYNVLGYHVNTLEVYLEGNVYVKNLGVIMRDP